MDLKALHAKIDQPSLETEFFGRRAQQGRVVERKAMIDREHPLPAKCQAELLGISRGSVYYQPVAIAEAELALMRPMLSRVSMCPAQSWNPSEVIRPSLGRRATTRLRSRNRQAACSASDLRWCCWNGRPPVHTRSG